MLFWLNGHDEIPGEVVGLKGDVLGLIFLLYAEQRHALAKRLTDLRRALRPQR